jgi:hypothetical protein
VPLDEILSSVMGQDGDSSAGFDTTTTEAAGEEAGSESPSPSSEAQAPEPEPEQPFNWENIPAELVPLAKGFQADYTRKSQELAAQRKQFEGLDPSYAQQWANLMKMTEEDPARAAAWLRSQAEWLQQQAPVADEGETDLLQTVEPQSETERLLWEKLQEMEQQQKQFQGFYEQQVLEQQKQSILSEFSALEGKIGRQLPQPERDAVMQFCVDNGINRIEIGYRAYAYDDAVRRAEQSGVDKGAAVVTQKAAMSPPPVTLANRQANGAGAARGLDAILNQAFEQESLDE